MKLLTNYFQSLELVAAGLPGETADYIYHKGNEYDANRKRYEPAFPHIPCWSAGALWEYIHGFAPDRVCEFDTSLSADQLMEALVVAVCDLLGNG